MELTNKPKAKRFSLKAIKDTGIVKRHSNGGRSQEIIYKNMNGKKFRLLFLSESYDFQSYAKLYMWDEESHQWNIITTANPKRDYNINIAYKNEYSSYAFNPIINDFRKLIKEFS
jgi:hypothetical protein